MATIGLAAASTETGAQNRPTQRGDCSQAPPHSQLLSRTTQSSMTSIASLAGVANFLPSDTIDYSLASRDEQMRDVAFDTAFAIMDEYEKKPFIEESQGLPGSKAERTEKSIKDCEWALGIRLDNLQKRVDDMQASFSDALEHCTKTTTSKLDTLQNNILELSTTMMTMFQRCEKLQTRLGETVNASRDEMHSDKEIMAEFQRVQLERFNALQDELGDINNLLRYTVYAEPTTDLASKRTDYPLLSHKHPLSRLNFFKRSKQRLNLNTTVHRAHTAVTDSLSTNPESPPQSALSGHSGETFTEGHLEVRGRTVSKSVPLTPPFSDDSTPNREALLQRETIHFEMEVMNTSAEPLNPGSSNPVTQADEEARAKAQLCIDASSVNDMPSKQTIPSTGSNSLPDSEANMHTFDLSLHRSPSPLTSIESGGSDDDVEFDGGERRHRIHDDHDNVPSTSSSTNAPEERDVYCPNASIGCTALFKNHEDISRHISRCKFTLIDLPHSLMPKSPRSTGHRLSNSPNIPLGHLQTQSEISFGSTSQLARRKRKVDGMSGGTVPSAKKSRGRRMSSHTSRSRRLNRSENPDSAKAPTRKHADRASGIWPVVQLVDDNHDWRLIQCDKCDKFYHFCCAGIKVNDFRLMPGVEYVCPFCLPVDGLEAKTYPTEDRLIEDACNRPECELTTSENGQKQFMVESLIGRLSPQNKTDTKGQQSWLIKWVGYPVYRAEWNSSLDAEDETWAKLIEDFNAAAVKEGLDLLSLGFLFLREAREGGWSGIQHDSEPRESDAHDERPSGEVTCNV